MVLTDGHVTVLFLSAHFQYDSQYIKGLPFSLGGTKLENRISKALYSSLEHSKGVHSDPKGQRCCTPPSWWVYSALTCAASGAANGRGVSLRLVCSPPEFSSGVKMLRLMQTQSSAWLLGQSQPTHFPAVAPGVEGPETLCWWEAKRSEPKQNFESSRTESHSFPEQWDSLQLSFTHTSHGGMRCNVVCAEKYTFATREELSLWQL